MVDRISTRLWQLSSSSYNDGESWWVNRASRELLAQYKPEWNLDQVFTQREDEGSQASEWKVVSISDCCERKKGVTCTDTSASVDTILSNLFHLGQKPSRPMKERENLVGEKRSESGTEDRQALHSHPPPGLYPREDRNRVRGGKLNRGAGIGSLLGPSHEQVHEREEKKDEDEGESKEVEPQRVSHGFVSARERLGTKAPRREQKNNLRDEEGRGSGIAIKKRRTFKPPARINPNEDEPAPRPTLRRGTPGATGSTGFRPDRAIKNAIQQQGNQTGQGEDGLPPEYLEEPRLRGLDPALIERIESEVLQTGDPIRFDDIAGLRFAKENIEEIVVWPLKNPEYYTGLRQLPKGLLLFGPPGTGKTLIGKAIAHEVSATFFSISASSLTSKWIGEGEKTVRALFGVAAVRQPAVIFIDEVDSLLTQRSADENESSRRIKTEFLVQLDGAATSSQEKILVIGATNRPQELDEAARRRFIKRLYIPLPDAVTRTALLKQLLAKNEHSLVPEQIQTLCELTEGYSGADVTNLAREASMGPLRDKMRRKMEFGPASSTSSGLRPICFRDFEVALKSIRASVSQEDLAAYIKWNDEFGTQEYNAGPEATVAP